MITIVEPIVHIDRVWGKQKIIEDGKYRLMQYVLRVDYDGKVLLHNTVSGQLVELSQAEAEALNELPTAYKPAMEALIRDHYLVLNSCDEHYQVLCLRDIFQKIINNGRRVKGIITSYTILPTTACNARCYYCFEHGVPSVTMSEQTAEYTVEFIKNHYDPESVVSIRWFGGEPTIAANRIDQICIGLQNNGIKYSSSMTTNGYLLDDNMVERAKLLWNLRDVMISIDGTERNYNEIKAYVNAEDNPYQRVLRNIGYLLDQEISVSLRMNFDIDNYQDFKEVLNEAKNRFHNNKKLMVYAFPIEGAYPNKHGKISHASDEWLFEKVAELNDMARDMDLFHMEKELPSLNVSSCNAGSPNFMVITAKGELGRCSGIFYEHNQIVGNVKDGLTDNHYYDSWRRFADPCKCRSCTFFPSCMLIERCPSRDKCFQAETYQQYKESVEHVYYRYKNDDLKMKGGI